MISVIASSQAALAEMALPQTAHDIMAYAAYGLYLLFIAGGGLWAVLARNLVRAMFGLVVTFMGVAGMYLLMASPFLAFMQLLIYVGAIAVLLFFAIMLVKNTRSGEEMRLPGPVKALDALIAAAAPLLLFGPIIVMYADKFEQTAPPLETPLAELGEGLLGFYVMPFEMISVVLLVAMAGGVLLAWDKRFKK